MWQLVVVAVVVMASCASAWSGEPQTALAPDNTAQKEIESSIRQFFTSMSKRDVEGLQAVLDARLVGLEATGQNAQIHWLDTADSGQILPPKGNNDWNDVKIADVKIEISATHPSVAIASFALVLPLDARKAAGFQSVLKDAQIKITDAQRTFISRAIKEQAISSVMFAMLAHRRDKWRIVCMSFPK